MFGYRAASSADACTGCLPGQHGALLRQPASDVGHPHRLRVHALEGLTRLSQSASMDPLNEIRDLVILRNFMDDDQGWGREAGRIVYQRLLAHVEATPGVIVFRLSFRGVRRVDISFASETVVELARRYKGAKGFCLADFTDVDFIENLEAAASKKMQPLMIWQDDAARVIGAEPTQGQSGSLGLRTRSSDCSSGGVFAGDSGHVDRECQHEVQAVVGAGLSPAPRGNCGERRRRVRCTCRIK